MSSVDFCAWQLHFNCHCSISMSASRQCRPRPTRSNRAIGGGSLRRSCVEEMCVNVGEVDLEAKATSSTSRVTCMAAPMHILSSPSRQCERHSHWRCWLVTASRATRAHCDCSSSRQIWYRARDRDGRTAFLEHMTMKLTPDRPTLQHKRDLTMHRIARC
jgi:hypothetical protein